ncbi:hypothetical protein TNCV_915401 [Trichonephila clavipes]|nr:hypothetical protein TNCV_915401 [Trichonephila clavipes]
MMEGRSNFKRITRRFKEIRFVKTSCCETYQKADISQRFHSADKPIPDPPKKYEVVRDYVEEEFIRPEIFHYPDFEAEDLNEPYRLNQTEPSDFVRDLDLPKPKAEFLASRLQQWNLLLASVKITE